MIASWIFPCVVYTIWFFLESVSAIYKKLYSICLNLLLSRLFWFFWAKAVINLTIFFLYLVINLLNTSYSTFLLYLVLPPYFDLVLPKHHLFRKSLILVIINRQKVHAECPITKRSHVPMANPVTEWGMGEAASARGRRKGLPRGWLVHNDVHS